MSNGIKGRITQDGRLFLWGDFNPKECNYVESSPPA